MPGLQTAPPQAVRCLHKHATFKDEEKGEKKVEGSQQNRNRNKSKYPLGAASLRPQTTTFLLFVAYVFSCLGADL